MEFAGGVSSVFHRRLELMSGKDLAPNRRFSKSPYPVIWRSLAHQTFDYMLRGHRIGTEPPWAPCTASPQCPKGSKWGFGGKMGHCASDNQRRINVGHNFFFRFLNPGLWWTFTPSLEVLTPNDAKSVTGTGPLWRTDLGKPSVCVCATLRVSN